MVVPVPAVPPSIEGFYAINNQFLVNGPKGFTEYKILENGDVFFRIDLPGVPKHGVRVFLGESKQAVLILANAPKEHKHDFSERNYDGTRLRFKLRVNGEKIPCTCYEYSGFTSSMSDGVLRLIVNKIHHTTHRPPCTSVLSETQEHILANSDPQDPNLTGLTLMPHPSIIQGSQMAYESKVLQNGGLYVRVDMPGVPEDNFTVSVSNGRVRVTGEAPAVSHDSSGRFYSGDVAILSSLVDLPIRKIKTIAKNGVIRLIIPPV